MLHSFATASLFCLKLQFHFYLVQQLPVKAPLGVLHPLGLLEAQLFILMDRSGQGTCCPENEPLVANLMRPLQQSLRQRPARGTPYPQETAAAARHPARRPGRA